MWVVLDLNKTDVLVVGDLVNVKETLRLGTPRLQRVKPGVYEYRSGIIVDIPVYTVYVKFCSNSVHVVVMVIDKRNDEGVMYRMVIPYADLDKPICEVDDLPYDLRLLVREIPGFIRRVMEGLAELVSLYNK